MILNPYKQFLDFLTIYYFYYMKTAFVLIYAINLMVFSNL